ncbi:mannose-6-phosphate isomerase type 1 [Thermolongibacillus altinsuensis]|jgi:mannose-6-phosphate isomerase|uniref:Mannose-6-phosphate isomerase n=1 Tax=Thermolongibacillus altinsuensis TaxID=575256 RepID=A0A4R1QGX3_9BACL|nr:mannose-6-phosphate isomerase, class I [Thermolongibacillus altinsuensis]TCL52778.1 mannose-6-phosphate isomerase type 1 [Thermolongibacillus altinsuensis]
MKQPIFLRPVFQERIWGGTKLRDLYGYDIPSEQTGECWAISAHPNGQSVVRSGKFEGMTLGQLWDEHRELFGHYDSDRFPLLTKILDANDDLSVQVHPDDEYARTYENGELGKTECWYVIDCEEGAEIILGHNARTKEELVEMIEKGQWDKLLRRVKVKPGDFFYVPSGTIHALCSGLLILETQQSSDTTYRVYDYDRRDKNGNLRELHLDKAIDVTTVPHVQTQVEPTVVKTAGATITTFVESEYFTVYKWDVHEHLELEQDQPFMLVSVIDGEGTIITEEGEWKIRKGDHLILPYQLGTFQVKGTAQMIVSHP